MPINAGFGTFVKATVDQLIKGYKGQQIEYSTSIQLKNKNIQQGK